MAKPWRNLETLVRDLERLLAGGNVVVKSPDHLPDRVTGELREVDVSLRAKVGSVEILIIIECRRRGARQDVTWIEQIATKAADVGASRAIAVSSKSFTKQAITKAGAKNIELRSFSELADGHVLQWLGGVEYGHEIANLMISARMPPESAYEAGVVTPLGNTQLDAPMFLRMSDGTPVSIFNLIPLRKILMDLHQDVPLGQSKAGHLIFDVQGDEVGFKAPNGIGLVSRIEFDVRSERRLANASSVSFHYEEPGGSTIARGTQLTFDHFGIPLKVDFAQPGGAEQPAAISFRREDHDPKRLVSMDFVFGGQDGDEPLVISSGLIRARPATESSRSPRQRRDRQEDKGA